MVLFMDTKDLIKAVRAHANANYENGGWDILVECMDDEEIARDIGTATTPAQAIKNVGRSLKICDDHRKDIQTEAF